MIKYIAFCIVLLYASIVDIKKRTVPTHIHILLILTGLLDVSLLSFAGLFLTFLPLFVVFVIKNGGIGGGDVKLAGACGFVLQGINGLIAVMLGSVIAISFKYIQHYIFKKNNLNKPFALVPYLSAGCFIVSLILI